MLDISDIVPDTEHNYSNNLVTWCFNVDRTKKVKQVKQCISLVDDKEGIYCARLFLFDI